MADYEFTESARAAEASLETESDGLLKKFKTAADEHGQDSEAAKKAAGELGRNEGEREAASKLFKLFGVK